MSGQRLRLSDAVRVATIGLRTRRSRAVLSLTGVAIGIASMVAVMGISESSKSGLLEQIERLGTDLLTVSPGQSFFGEDSALPAEAEARIGRIAEQSAAVEQLGVTVRRSDRIASIVTGGLAVVTAEPDLLTAMGSTMLSGRFLDDASADLPVVVLGRVAAERLGITRTDGSVRVWIGDEWFTVIGIMGDVVLSPALERSVFVGTLVAGRLLGATGNPTTIYARAGEERTEYVASVLAASANPERPEEVSVSRPSDALYAQAQAKGAFTSLFLGLGAVALLVGAVGIANVMVIAVLERRGEIGLRRALGATRRHIRVQFLGEALSLAGLGGIAGGVLGAAATAVYAATQGWSVVVPPLATGGGVAAALIAGAVAGLYPAARAARISPVEALRSG